MRTVNVQLDTRSYPIHIGPGARQALPELVRTCSGVRQIVGLTDENVGPLHAAALQDVLEERLTVLTVGAGEASKSLEVVGRLYDELAAARVERGDLLITLGGGVVGDLGGFVAATWLRGIRFAQVPTTLLAAVDASVGGKTGVNHPSGKNLIGAFHQPIGVVVDTDFLATLSPRDFTAGLGESVKHAAILDEVLLEWHETRAAEIVGREAGALSELIARNCAIKAAVVSQDEREQGLRAILNFGHTIGHAIEHLFEYELRHGECVALGMAAANELAHARGELDGQAAERIRTLLDRLGLPTRLPQPVDPGKVAEVCRMDKKVRGGAVHFVLLRAIGETMRASDVTDAEIEAAVGMIQP